MSTNENFPQTGILIPDNEEKPGIMSELVFAPSRKLPGGDYQLTGGRHTPYSTTSSTTSSTTYASKRTGKKKLPKHPRLQSLSNKKPQTQTPIPPILAQ